MLHSCNQGKMTIWSFCLILFLSNSILVLASHVRHLCRADQKNALLEFKNEFYVQELNSNGIVGDKKTEKWRNNTDCCTWDGISCDPKTGKVVELDLMNSFLNGPLRYDSSLFRLQHLHSLVLGSNNFSGTLPNSIGNLKYLRVLSLGDCHLFGKIPSSLGNLTYLTNLDLSVNDFTGELPDSMGNLNKLTELHLRSAKLSGKFPSVLLNMSELTLINLGSNQFEENNFSGPIPESISKLVGLFYLDLSLWNTERAMVDFNMFLQLESLMFLDLSYINTRSTLDTSIFSPLLSLGYLDLSGINLKTSSTLSLPSPMGTLILASCNIAEFPKFLENQTTLYYLDISANRIEGQVPEWLWSLPDLKYVNISQNSFSGFEGPVDVIQRCGELIMLDISSNAFHHPFPLLPNSTTIFLGSDNRFSGEVPRTICKLVSLDTLVLSNNNFNGSIPRCFENFNTTLSVLHLRNNNFSGTFSEESVSEHLRSVDVGRNRLSGELPKSLINCTRLEFLNVEDNIISDRFPLWLRSLPSLQILVLRSNDFHGPISFPGESSSFNKLRIFDISENRFSGVLPSHYFAGWSAMSSVIDIVDVIPSRYAGRDDSGNYQNSVTMTAKGSKIELVGSVFAIYKTIDVSGNKFKGGIPESIALLKELIVLNMSNNAFTSSIPPALSNLTNLESLDLSKNRLSGKIPPELGKLTFLAQMNFSYNRLEGPIPQGTQIQSQKSSSFAENPGLCGVPLQETCGGGGEEEELKKEQGEQKEQVFSWIAAAVGYVPGLVCGLTIGHILTSYKREWFMRIFHYFT
ncbi:PREDICTED: receptor-like protein 12 isoform X1 [Camelina sativa]|uniref:Receptor-like protein 12 isoform X1 n=1 Tax=Camelina sativa TaxID=90675 RepID=A0ABM0Y5G0_CAMSA|nr:PREDICTED: receptor-like protein 12 isoform X1 [Camelina sativa]